MNAFHLRSKWDVGKQVSKSRLGQFFPCQRNNVSDQKKKAQVVLLRAPRITHPSVNWTMFSISTFKSTLFLYLLLCNQERGNFPCSYPFHIFFFFSLLHYMLLSSVLPCLTWILWASFRLMLRQSAPSTKTEICFQVCKSQCLLSEASIFRLSFPIITKCGRPEKPKCENYIIRHVR